MKIKQLKKLSPQNLQDTLLNTMRGYSIRYFEYDYYADKYKLNFNEENNTLNIQLKYADDKEYQTIELDDMELNVIAEIIVEIENPSYSIDGIECDKIIDAEEIPLAYCDNGNCGEIAMYDLEYHYPDDKEYSISEMSLCENCYTKLDNKLEGLKK